MKIIAIIPARYHSKRFPGKPLALIAGIPMIQHVYQRSKKCAELDEAYVATDDIRIYNCVKGFGGKVIMTVREHPSGTDRIFEATEKIKTDDQDIVVNIQGDQPVFRPSIISDLIRPLKDDPKIPMSTLMYKIKKDTDIQDINKVKVVFDSNKYALYFSRLPIPFCRDKNIANEHYKHIGVYAYRKEFLRTFTKLSWGILEKKEKLEQLRALEHGFKIKLIETVYDSIEVDAPENIKIVEEKLFGDEKNFI
ncbi:MAG: 3-deoxy-manno-octulosonate cytidylyltransferase [Thermodesulfobacteriota bacterium]|nr:3-deoxy-manno-octulosonate cytidylyltransferase [Thermodesulfobacteriota bacterium]